MKTESKGVLKIDVMKFFYNQERFVKTLTYKYLPCFKMNLDDIYKFVIASLPSLEGEKRIKLYFDDKAVESIVFYPLTKQPTKKCRRNSSTLTRATRIA